MKIATPSFDIFNLVWRTNEVQRRYESMEA